MAYSDILNLCLIYVFNKAEQCFCDNLYESADNLVENTDLCWSKYTECNVLKGEC